ncbi:MAG: hypothetical protein V1866_07055 [archaeon]
MGIFDVFRKRHDEPDMTDFGTELGSRQMPEQGDPFAPQPTGLDTPLGAPDQQQSMGFGMPPQPQQQMPPQQQKQFTPEDFGFEKVPQSQQPRGSGSFGGSVSEINFGKDLEIISAKLDSIKAELDSMNQRLKRIERIAEEPGSSRKDAWNY